MIIDANDVDPEDRYNEKLRVEMRPEFQYPEPDKAVAVTARGDHMNESLIGKSFEEIMEGTDKSFQEFLDDKVTRGHWGVYEHPSSTFFVENLSYYGHAYLVRHRHMSFDVQSRRYNKALETPIITPTSNVEVSDIEEGAALPESWDTAIDMAKEAYQDAIDGGYGKQHARAIMPQGAAVHLSFTSNLRSAFHWLDLRRNGKAHPEARQLGIMLTELLEEWAPRSMEAYERNSNNNSLRAP